MTVASTADFNVVDSGRMVHTDSSAGKPLDRLCIHDVRGPMSAHPAKKAAAMRPPAGR